MLACFGLFAIGFGLVAGGLLALLFLLLLLLLLCGLALLLLLLAAALGNVSLALRLLGSRLARCSGFRLALAGGGCAFGGGLLALFGCTLRFGGSSLLTLLGLALCRGGGPGLLFGCIIGGGRLGLLRRRTAIATRTFFLRLGIPDLGHEIAVLRRGLPLHSQREQADQDAVHQQRSHQRQAAAGRGRRHQAVVGGLQAGHGRISALPPAAPPGQSAVHQPASAGCRPASRCRRAASCRR